MGREGVLDQGVEDGPRAVDVELDPVHLVDLDPVHGQLDHLGVAEVLRAVGGQGHGRLQRGDQPQVDQVHAAPGDQDVAGLDVLVPQAGAVELVEAGQEVGRVGHGQGQVAVLQALGARGAVHARGHHRELVALDEGHHVVEADRGELVLQHQAQLLGGLQGAALAHDLGQGGALREGEGLDDHLARVGVSAGLEGGELLAGGLGQEQAAARAAALHFGEDGVAGELARGRLGAPAGAGRSGVRRPGDHVRNPALEPLGERGQAQEADGVAQGHPVQGEQAAGQLVLDRPGVVARRPPAEDQQVEDAQRKEEERGQDSAHEAQAVHDRPAQEAEHVDEEEGHSPEGAPHAVPQPLAQLPEQQHRHDGHGDGAEAQG